MKKLLLFSLLLTLNFSFAQDKTGYWDTNRKTSSIIKLSKGQLGHLEVKLPIGTTEIAYRIVPTSKYIGALDDFSEALKNSGDKRALAAGYTASFISKLSNDVKCKYGVFNDIKSITNFQKLAGVKMRTIPEHDFKRMSNQYPHDFADLSCFVDDLVPLLWIEG